MLKATKREEFLSTDTKAIKGIGILLMLMHHLWSLPERIAGGELKHLININEDSLISYLGDFGQICVPLFFFLGGYGVYKQAEKKDFSIINNLKKLYKSYWKVFLIFIPIALIFFTNQGAYCADPSIYARFDSVSFMEIFRNFIGESWSLNGEWWFLKSYLIAILSFPLVKEIIDNKTLPKNIFLVIITSISLLCIFPGIGNIEQLGPLSNSYLYTTFFTPASLSIVSFWVGMIFAKENLLIKIKEKLNLNIVKDLLILLAIMYLRLIVLGKELDILYVPFLIITLMDFLNEMPPIKRVFTNIGVNSTNMWLIHSFYCYYFYPVVKVVVGLKWAVPSLIVLLILTYISSYILDYFWKFINYIFTGFNKTFNKKIAV